MKKLIAMLLSLVMIVSLMPTVAFATGSSIELTVNTSECATAKEGDAVSIPVYITENPGVNMIIADVVYDTEKFDFVSIEGSTDFIGDGTYEIYNTKFSWETDGGDNVLSDVLLFTVNLTVKKGAKAGTTTITVNEDSIDCSDGEFASFGGTVVPGTITIVYETTGLSFVNGSQSMSYNEAKADAEGANTLTAPGDGYYFAGWFAGLSDDYKNADTGYYVIEPAENLTDISGTELRPRYDTPPTEGTYNALWIKGAASYVLAVNDEADNFDVYYAATDYDALNAAVNGYADGERVKLIKDMSTQYVTYNNANSTSLWLDVNGCAVQSTQYYVLKMNSNSTAYSLKIDSGRAGGSLAGTGNYAPLQSLGQSAIDIRDIKLTGKNLIQFYSGTIRDCEIINNSTSTNALQVSGGDVTISDCTIDSDGKLISVGAGTATINNCVMVAGNSAAPFTGKNNSSPSGVAPPSGKIIFGEGCKVTAENATVLCQNFEEVKFETLNDTYQIASTANAPFTNVTTVTTPENKAYGVDNGLLKFGSSYKVTYKSWDGQTTIAEKQVVEGCAVDLSVTVDTYGNAYNHLGWALEKEGTVLTSYTVNGDTTLYAVREEKGVIIWGSEVTTEDYVKHYDYLETVTIDNAHKLGALNSLDLGGQTIERDPENTDNNTNIIDKTMVYVKFFADALDSIAENVSSSAMISVEGLQHNIGNVALARVNLSITENSAPVNFTGDVEVMVEFVPVEGKAYQVFYVPTSGELEALPTQIVEQDGNKYAKFTTTHFSTFEVREIEAEVPEINTEDIFEDKTGTTTPAAITAPAGGWQYGVENTFTVSCDKACVVAYTTDGGNTYTRLDATEANDGYSFTVTLTQEMKLVVAIKGDVNSDGTLDIFDVTKLSKVVAGKDKLEAGIEIAAYVNDDGEIDIFDVTKLSKVAAGSDSLTW